MEDKDSEENKSLHSKRIKQFVKIAVPHVALYVLLFFYLLAGAWAFASIEHNAERLQQLKKLERIDTVYRQISEEMIDECAIKGNQHEKFFNEQLYESLSRLSKFMEGKDFKLTPHYSSTTSDEQKADQLNAILPPR